MSNVIPRYLAAFHPKRLPHYFTDVLIVGSGLAGLRAALAVDAAQSVLVVTKENLAQSNSTYAQGGIAGVLSPDDCFESHISDTLQAGGSLCDRQVVEMVVREAPERIQELIGWGAHFDESAGELSLGREGGHSQFRVVHAHGDATGREVMRAVIDRITAQENIQVREDVFTLDLLTDGTRVRGALVWTAAQGMSLVWAKQTILCTGGAGQVYRETTNPAVATGDGLAMAYRAGAEVRDMEFMQFHPTMLYIAGSSRSLITEAVRGEGAHLVDRDGHRFMPEYDDRAELAPRDVVSQSIVSQMEKTRHPNVYLDLSHLDAQFVHERFPGISARCAEFDLDIARDRIPVRPGAHYLIGGLTVDAEGRTTLDGLWAAGEVSASGLHGANRLASNSLLESLVFGAHAARGASREAAKMSDDYHGMALANPPVINAAESLDLADIRNSLKSRMWRNVGIRRDREGLEDAAQTVEYWCRYVLPRQFHEPQGWQLQNMLVVSRLMIAGALARTESRGVHFRADLPQPDDQFAERHITFARGDAA